jgi:hypothetical protein
MLKTFMLQNLDVDSLHINRGNNATTDSLLVYSTTIASNPLTNIAQVYADFSSGNYHIPVTQLL